MEISINFRWKCRWKFRWKFRKKIDEISIHELDVVALNWPAAVGLPPVLWWDAAQDRIFFGGGLVNKPSHSESGEMFPICIRDVF